MTVTIRNSDLIDSVADALQYISYFHPMDYIRALGDAYTAEQSPAAKDAIAQILTNSRMCAEGHRPICQDTGIVNVFVKWGMDCRLEDTSAPRYWPTLLSRGVTPKITRPASCMSKWSPVQKFRWMLRQRAAAARISQSSR
jgi:tartrate dehydratase alpha subunit/fumarate hydratase class I-like protein